MVIPLTVFLSAFCIYFLWLQLNRTEGKSNRQLRFCPKCGSTDIWWPGGLPFLAPYMECKRCGHRGVFIVGDRELAEKIQEEYVREKMEDEE